VRGLGYYTGLTFAGYAPGSGSAVAAGGRYDGLLARFGRPDPAIGFAVDLEFATQALERAGGGRRGGGLNGGPPGAARRRRRA
jgi:ATP phosphoribosyltransferase regulatory subunit